MSDAFLILGHATLGMLAGFLLVFVYAELHHASEANIMRIRYLGTAGSVLAYLGIYFGLDFYLNSYGDDKAIIKAGDWDWAHSFFTETKEHIMILGIFILFITILALWRTEPHKDPQAKKLLFALVGILFLGAIFLEGWGAIMAYGLKEGLLG
ncbi:MAG: hypothetical protein ACTSYA_10720 [Candidatus Kariarchaeaceae archaeon]